MPAAQVDCSLREQFDVLHETSTKVTVEVLTPVSMAGTVLTDEFIASSRVVR